MRVFIGVDPGQTGAIGWVNEDNTDYGVIDMPLVGKEMDTASIRGYLGCFEVIAAGIEYQQSFPKQGSQSAFVLGQGYGTILGMLAGLDYRHVIIRPNAWKQRMGVSGSDKEKSRAMAKRLFPLAPLNLVKHHGRAEALLIALDTLTQWPKLSASYSLPKTDTQT